MNVEIIQIADVYFNKKNNKIKNKTTLFMQIKRWKMLALLKNHH